MGSLFGGGGSSDGGAGAMRRGANQALRVHGDAALKVLGQGRKLVDPNKQASKLYRQGLGRISEFEPRAMLRAAQAYEANIKPIQAQITEQLGNQFAGLGQAGRRSSRGQFAQAALAQQLQEQGSRQLFDIGEQARQRQLQESLGLLSPGSQALGQELGLIGKQADVQTGIGQGIAGINNLAASQAASQAAQDRSQTKGGIGSLIGTGVGAVTSLFSDIRLKENIKPVGQLDNGLTVYSYNYKGSDIPQIGLIAQEVEGVRPNAVSKDANGYLKVNYEEAVK